MKRTIGLVIILLAFPLLITIHGAIATEFNKTSTLQTNLNESILLSPPKKSLPILMKDQNDNIFSERYTEWRVPLNLKEIPQFVQHLFLDSEDTKFYEHRGYDMTAIARAFVANAATDNLSQGGSTITQQLVRMNFLSPEKTYARKLTELFYAAELEKQNDKDKILEMYLNDMYFGNQVYGIGGAATYYFNKPIAQLNEAEMAFLAAIPNNPAHYNPLKHFENTKKRQELLIDIVAKNDRISEDESKRLKETPIQLSVKEKVNHSHAYSTYILNEVSDLIAHSEGFEERFQRTDHSDEAKQIAAELQSRTAEVLSDGIIIETSYDPIKQKNDEASMNRLLSPNNLQAGAVVIDNATRKIVSIYGGRNYQTDDFNRAFQAVRQPGSAIKPLLLYAPVIEQRRYTENSLINSQPICIGNFCPENVGGSVYGMTSVKEAFRYSHNTAAVRLLRELGIEEAFTFLEPFQFRSISSHDKNYSAALGGFSKGVTPLEMADAYTSFINGSYRPARAIRAIKDYEGNTLYEWDNDFVEIWSPHTVSSIRNLLEDVVLYGTGRNVTYRPSYTGGKTGTTDNYKDFWMVGFNDQYTTAVWIGYDMPRSMQTIVSQQPHLKAFSMLIK